LYEFFKGDLGEQNICELRSSRSGDIRRKLGEVWKKKRRGQHRLNRAKDQRRIARILLERGERRRFRDQRNRGGRGGRKRGIGESSRKRGLEVTGGGVERLED